MASRLFGGGSTQPGNAAGNVANRSGAAGLQSQRQQPPKDKALAAKDPLLNKAHQKGYAATAAKETSGSRAKDLVQTVVLVLVPFVFYVGTLFCTIFLYYAYPGLVMTVVAIALFVASLQYLVVTHLMKTDKWRRWIGCLSAIAIILAYMDGMLIHYHYMLFYHKYTSMMRYSNVAASQNAQLFQDAGMLQFTSGTKVDSTRAVGFRNIRTSKTLCVAPLVDSQMSKDEPIVFFAIGENCCGWRATFQCGGAGANSGLLMLEPEMLTSPTMTWAVDGAFDFGGYEKAVNLTKAVFSLAVSKNHRFLKWVPDPQKNIDQYRQWAFQSAGLACAVYFAIAAAFVIRSIVMKTLRQKAMASKLMANKSMLQNTGGDESLA